MYKVSLFQWRKRWFFFNRISLLSSHCHYCWPSLRCPPIHSLCLSFSLFLFTNSLSSPKTLLQNRKGWYLAGWGDCLLVNCLSELRWLTACTFLLILSELIWFGSPHFNTRVSTHWSRTYLVPTVPLCVASLAKSPGWAIPRGHLQSTGCRFHTQLLPVMKQESRSALVVNEQLPASTAFLRLSNSWPSIELLAWLPGAMWLA